MEISKPDHVRQMSKLIKSQIWLKIIFEFIVSYMEIYLQFDIQYRIYGNCNPILTRTGDN